MFGGHFEKATLTEGRTPVPSYGSRKQVSIYSLSTNIYYEKLKEISDLTIFLNACAGHIWPAGRYLPTPGLNVLHVQNQERKGDNALVEFIVLCKVKDREKT